MLYFDKVKLLSYTHRPVFFEGGLRYRVIKNITIRGYLREASNYEGVEEILDKQELLTSSANDWEEIVINGISFGEGMVRNVSFDGGYLIRTNEYDFEIECYENGNLQNALNGVYEGLLWDSNDALYIDSLSEDFDYSLDENGDAAYGHSISVRYGGNNTKTQKINLAKALAANFFSSTNGIGAYIDYAGIANIRKLYTESYDEITCECSFSESASIPNLRSGNYSYQLSYGITKDAKGFYEVQEAVAIKGLTAAPLASAKEGLDALKAAARTRTQAVFEAYGFSDVELSAAPISTSVGTNKFTGEITLTNTFSNNPRFQATAIWEYEISLELNNQGIYTVSEQGSVIGYGKPGAAKYAAALAFFNANADAASVSSRLDALYATTGRTDDLYLIATSFGKNEFAGRIEYSYNYTDDALLSDSDFKIVRTEIAISNPSHIHQFYAIFNFGEIAQTQNQSSAATKSISVNLKGKRNTTFDAYLTRAKTVIASNIPVEENFLQDCSYSYNIETNDFQMDANYVFIGDYKTAADLTVT